MKAFEPLPLPLGVILDAYAHGYFPMGEGYGDDSLHWYNPPQRAVMPIAGLHVPRKLRKLALRHPFEIRINTAFADVIAGCMENRPNQWITADIRIIFNALHRAGYAHSVECWQGGALVGGIYGLALGQAFCAESMFSRIPAASKIALLHLCARLHFGGFTLLDCQILNDHTAQFGAHDIPQTEYLDRLGHAMQRPGDFYLHRLNPRMDTQTLLPAFFDTQKNGNLLRNF